MNYYVVTMEGRRVSHNKEGAISIDVWYLDETTNYQQMPASRGRYAQSHTLDGVMGPLKDTLAYASSTTKEAYMLVYVLQISVSKPTRFRIDVVERKLDLAAAIDDTQWKHLALCSNPEEVMTTLTPYLKMEEGIQ